MGPSLEMGSDVKTGEIFTVLTIIQEWATTRWQKNDFFQIKVFLIQPSGYF